MGRPKKTAGDYIKEWRRRRGLSQRQGAEALGMSAPQLCGYEKGAKRPGINKMRFFKTQCGVPLEAW